MLLPLMCLAVFWTGMNPVTLVLIAGMMQAIMLPIIGFSSVFFRYKLVDPRIRPGRAWDVFLIVSCIGLLLAGSYGVFTKLAG